jgi:hypothetical protein
MPAYSCSNMVRLWSSVRPSMQILARLPSTSAAFSTAWNDARASADVATKPSVITMQQRCTSVLGPNSRGTRRAKPSFSANARPIFRLVPSSKVKPSRMRWPRVAVSGSYTFLRMWDVSPKRTMLPPRGGGEGWGRQARAVGRG